LSALYYADRINQLPIGVVGIAVGTVLLPEMSRRLAAGDERGAASAQARGIQLALLLTIPCAVSAIVIPDLIMRALFVRGAFTAENAAAAGATLAAYSFGLLPFVLLRSFTAPFYARGDTATPVKAALLAAGINVLLKILLMGHLAQVGLAAATSVGAWINLSLLAFFARRQGFAVSGAAIGMPVARLALSGAILGAALVAGAYGLERALAYMAHFREETILAILIVWGVLIYGGAVLVLLGQKWFMSLLREVSAAADTKAPALLPAPAPTDDSAALPDSEPPPRV
jgi:putative peptidoglycan lipid II flippase